MKRAILVLLLLLVFTDFAVAQLATDPNEGSWITRDSPGFYTMRWFGRMGRTYFIQESLDLFTWTYRTDIEAGQNLVIPYGHQTSSDKFFLRLRYAYPDIPTDDPANSDFDGDGVSNADELSRGLNPLSNVDLIGNGLPDDWEMFYFHDLTHTGTQDSDGDGFTNAEELLFGLNPIVDDSSATAKDLSYDALGRLQTAGSVTYTYDEEGNINAAN